MAWPLTAAATLAGGVLLQAGRSRKAARTPETTKVERKGINVVIVLERGSTLETSG
jgi:hypothetical protein